MASPVWKCAVGARVIVLLVVLMSDAGLKLWAPEETSVEELPRLWKPLSALITAQGSDDCDAVDPAEEPPEVSVPWALASRAVPRVKTFTEAVMAPPPPATDTVLASNDLSESAKAWTSFIAVTEALSPM